MLMLLPILSNAQSVEIDGIYYNLITKAKQAEVTTNPNKYTGHVVIPASVTYNGVEHSVTSIGQRAFFNCGNMTSITIPSSVTSIGEIAFYQCSSLTNLTIGSGVSSIVSKAFASCKELTDVYCLTENVPSTYNNAFQDSYIEYATLHVPPTSIDAYKAAEPWRHFKNIVEYIDPSGIQGVTLDKNSNTPVYDLNGRRMTAPAKGINLIGGKKVLVR